MLWDPAAIIFGTTVTAAFVLILSTAIRRSTFGWLMLSVEYFYVLGLGVFPLLVGLGIVGLPDLLAGYESRNGEIRYDTYLHVSLYLLGAIVGYFVLTRSANSAANKVVRLATSNKIDNSAGFYFIATVCFLTTGLYVALVGIDTALLTATTSRGGDFSGLRGVEQFQFLKRLATIGVFAVIFLPHIIVVGKRVVSSFLILVLVAVSVYLQTVSRVAVFETIGIFVILYYALGGRWTVRFGLLIAGVATLLLFVFVYGKTFVAAFAAYVFEDSRFELVRFGMSDDELEFFFFHFGHLIYSVDAGLREFAAEGSTVPRDVLLAPLGFIPSGFFLSAGLEAYSYQLVPEPDKLACINTSYFVAFGECFVPAYLPGFSAYVLPFVAAFAFGAVRFWTYSAIERAWRDPRIRSEDLWFPYLLFLLMFNVLIAIPSSIAFAVFVSILAFVILLVVKIFFRRRSSEDFVLRHSK